MICRISRLGKIAELESLWAHMLMFNSHGAEHWLKWINRDTGRRSDAAHAYIHSTRSKYDNLHLKCNTKVDKVIIEDGVAVGVETVPTKPLHPQENKRTIYRARKMIIVAGGTLSSPLILQRSGIGDPEKLRKVGVKPIIDLPGVGLNFQDHYLTFSVFRAKPNTDTFDDFARGDPKVQKKVFDEWDLKGTGPLATNGIEAGVKARPTEEELKAMEEWPTPEFSSGWKSYFKDKPDKPVMHYRYADKQVSLINCVSPKSVIVSLQDGSETTCFYHLGSFSPCSTSWSIRSHEGPPTSSLLTLTKSQISMQ
jgi:alcohol oxidase